MSATILFGIHCHQPVGNFEHVFERAFNRAYKPFLETVKDFSSFKFSMHISGPLIEWIKEKNPKFFDLIGRFIEDKRLEIQIGGFYEPILASIPSWDRKDQIILAKEFFKREFGTNATGLWLTERFWDSKIIKDLVECDIKYVIVDDYHLVCAGFEREEISGYYLTEEEGKTIALFPINEKLRYLIPFRKIDEITRYLEEKEGKILTIYDDGEKFGIWPGTYNWVYEKKWLKSFLKEIEKQTIKTDLFSNILSTTKATSRIYLPITSYFEMGEWSLPAHLGARFHKIVNELKAQGKLEEMLPFIRGGIWYNFLVKYPESNRMHKKMVWISRKLKDLPRISEEKVALFKAQCNDAYWHGIFGGLYLPHLRRAVYSHLAEAEKVIKQEGFVLEDIDCDGEKELFFKSNNYSAWIFPSDAAKLKDLTVYKWNYNLLDLLSRRIEHYHLVAMNHEKRSEVSSIHEIPKRLEENPEVDPYERGAFMERIFINEKRITLSDVRFELVRLNKNAALFSYEAESFHLEKEYILEDESISVYYKVESLEPFIFEVEININPATPQATIKTEDKSFYVKDFCEIEKINSLTMESPLLKGSIRIKVMPHSHLYSVPIYTLSQSERGFEKIFQEVALVFKFENSNKSFEGNFSLEVTDA